MGPNFMVDKSGILIASGAIFEGSITASAGLIGGFTTDSHSFSSTNIFISGSPKQGGIDSDEYKFISTQNFNNCAGKSYINAPSTTSNASKGKQRQARQARPRNAKQKKKTNDQSINQQINRQTDRQTKNTQTNKRINKQDVHYKHKHFSLNLQENHTRMQDVNTPAKS